MVKPALGKESQSRMGINRLLCSLSRNKQGNFNISLLLIESNITLHEYWFAEPYCAEVSQMPRLGLWMPVPLCTVCLDADRP